MKIVYPLLVCCVLFASACTTRDSDSPDGVANPWETQLSSLRWLKQQQHSDGHWGEKQNQIELTSLATLAFLYHGQGPDDSDKYGETVKKALEALMRDVESKAERTGETDAILTWCLSLAFGNTLHPMLLKSLDVQTNRLDFTQTTHWHVRAAKSLSYIDAYRPVGKQGLRTMCRSFPNNTTNMFNQASRLLLGLYSGDALLREFSFKTLRGMDFTQWRTQENPESLLLLLTDGLYWTGGEDWKRWRSTALADVKVRQIRKGKLGWWTPESLGITTNDLKNDTQREREVYLTSIVLCTIPIPGRYLLPELGQGKAIMVKEAFKSFKNDPDEVKVDLIENP